MKYFIFSLLFIFTLFVSSCQEDCVDNDNGIENPDGNGGDNNPGDGGDGEVASLWDNSHAFFMGLKGSPKSIKDIQSVRYVQDSEWEPSMIYKYTFNDKGNLTCYDPFTGMEQKARWVPVDAKICSYEYNEQGKIIKATIETPNVGIVTYTVDYGDHELYVPLPFKVGELDFVLTQGVSSVMVSDSNEPSEQIILTCNGISSVNVVSSEKMGFFTIHTNQKYSYVEGSLYPVNLKEERTMGEEVLDIISVDYTFSEKGYLLKKVYNNDFSGESGNEIGTDVTNIVTEYKDDAYMQPVSEKVHRIQNYLDEIEYELKYVYNSKGLLSGIRKYTGGVEDKDMESYSYLAFDNKENWTEAIFFYSDVINPGHISGEFKYDRNIEY